MKTTAIALLALLAIAGCRREDVRDVTIQMRGLAESDIPAVVQELSRYNGIDKKSFTWDVKAGTLNLKYDSMQIAQTNIRMAIEKAGVRVIYPEKTDNKAGH
jgi:hypothetical protein